MSQHDTLKSSAGMPAPGHGADLAVARSGDHEVDLLLSEIDERIASKGGAAAVDHIDSMSIPLDAMPTNGGPLTQALDDAPSDYSQADEEADRTLAQEGHQTALGEALAAVAPAGAAAAAAAGAATAASDEPSALPLIGKQSPAQQQRVLFGMIAGGAVALVLTGALALNAAGKQAGQLAATGQALMQSQRLAKSVSQALIGSPAAFPEMKESGEVLSLIHI